MFVLVVPVFPYPERNRTDQQGNKNPQDHI
jgi:hypothetical protein